MKKYFALCLFSLLCAAHSLGQSYWQQEANYKIDVTLDDVEHKLNGTVLIEYTNNAPNKLDTLYFHLWPNAYQKGSPLERQLSSYGKLKMRFARPEELGHIKNVAFTATNETISDQGYTDKTKEIYYVVLERPLHSGARIELHTPFNVKIPAVFSRLGHSGQHYNLTQWFPKIALYDSAGWHCMHYLDFGEYYDSFGDYEVSISAPSNYVIAATGNLKTTEEKSWLQERIKLSKRAIHEKDFSNFSDSSRSAEMKTLSFKQKNVHDFAWFASKNFLVLKEAFEVEGTKDTCFAWAFFTPDEYKLWEDAPQYLIESVQHYSKLVGPYPYKTVKAVRGPLEAGSGMEYPTITVIGGVGNQVKRVILHEVGHNWFQGMLGTNERRLPYLDEGFNTFFENKYFETRMSEKGFGDLEEIVTHALLRNNAIRCEGQACNLHSTDYTSANYGLVVYAKTSMMLSYLEAYIGKETFSTAMHQLFKKWKYKHPQPRDFQRLFERISGKNLDWFFQEMLSSHGDIDFAIEGIKDGQLIISNEGDIRMPVKIMAVGKDTLSFWTEPFSAIYKWKLPKNKNYQNFYVNRGIESIEKNAKNNYYKSHGLAKKFEKLGLAFFYKADKKRERFTTLTPVLGSNSSDGFMLGMLLHNGAFPQRKLEYQLMPMFGFGSNNITGMGHVAKNWFWQNGRYRKSFHAGLNAKRFGIEYFYAAGESSVFVYNKIEPYLEYKFRPAELRNPIQHRVYSRLVHANYQESFNTADYQESWRQIAEFTYLLTNSNPLFSYSAEGNFRTAPSEFARISMEFVGKLPYNEKRDISVRLFAGSFLGEPQNPLFNMRLQNISGRFDYMYDGLFFDRTRATRIGSRQRMLTDGGFYGNYNSFSSSQWLASTSISAELPFAPVRAFGNLAFMPNNIGTPSVAQPEAFFEGGLQLSIAQGILNINMPMVFSQNLQEYHELNQINFWSNITFNFNLKRLNPFKLSQTASALL